MHRSFIITEEERNRILGKHISATKKQYLFEAESDYPENLRKCLKGNTAQGVRLVNSAVYQGTVDGVQYEFYSNGTAESMDGTIKNKKYFCEGNTIKFEGSNVNSSDTQNTTPSEFLYYDGTKKVLNVVNDKGNIIRAAVANDLNLPDYRMFASRGAVKTEDVNITRLKTIKNVICGLKNGMITTGALAGKTWDYYSSTQTPKITDYEIKMSGCKSNLGGSSNVSDSTGAQTNTSLTSPTTRVQSIENKLKEVGVDLGDKFNGKLNQDTLNAIYNQIDKIGTSNNNVVNNTNNTNTNNSNVVDNKSTVVGNSSTDGTSEDT